ncbi:MAG: hypothetical protein COZ86_02470 [Candidatus Moranbacteria bacterium CG_4_8_14_3_um_filter_41_13]|nr:MAG: hypothetical protein COZ86_02470 [Candidatus Moranbacteria bacterium CG_4_8_14_3_um_filter_41_13]
MIQNKKKTPSPEIIEIDKSSFFVFTLEQFLKKIPVRSRNILSARFGLLGKSAETLEEIGQTYAVTRERVRQIIMSALGFLAEEREHPLFKEAAKRIVSALEEKGGIVRTEVLLDMLAPEDTKERGALLVFIECLSSVKETKATKECEKSYILKDFSFQLWEKVKNEAIRILKTGNQALSSSELFLQFQLKNETVDEQTMVHFLAVSKEVKQNVFGKWGLSQWSDIKPRGTREKAYLVLKTTGKLLHFREIASLIDSYGLKSTKKTQSHPQTVHNELIKDNRFILVGRGTYALAEWGYKKGTVREVLDEILRKSDKPLSREEILSQILKIRQVKKSTVIINLNSFFQRVGKDVYTVKK